MTYEDILEWMDEEYDFDPYEYEDFSEAWEAAYDIWADNERLEFPMSLDNFFNELEAN